MIYQAFFRLILERIDPERAHALALRSLRLLGAIPGALALLRRLRGGPDPTLAIRVFGLDFDSPLGVAAGLDKDAVACQPLLALGFGAVEVGTVTAQPQPGNPRPRATRLLRDRALLNAMGFPSEGAAVVARRLGGRRGGVIGVNVGKSKVVALEEAAADYRESVRLLAPLADYLVLNVSSPNTPQLRHLQATERLEELVAAVREELRAAPRRPPLLVKLAPDLDDAELAAVAELALRLELDGIVAVNTTTEHGLAAHSGAELAAQGHGGGLSGPPLQRRALEVLDLLRASTGGRLALISVGGIESAADAWERILRGASLVQAYTGFVYGGPLWPRRLNRELARLLRESEWETLAAAVGGGASGA